MQRTHDWYNKNEALAWPLDESATLIDDLGREFPSDILADLHLWFPESLGFRAFVSAITVSPTLVTLVILSEASGHQAVATISARQAVVPYRQYAMEPRADGVGGWVVFGSRVNDVSTTETYRFSNPNQSLLLARTARRYSRFPLTSVAKLNVQPSLTGIIRLSGGTDVETLKAQRTIGGVLRDVAVIRLKDKTTDGPGRNVDEIYAGICGRRPESLNCGSPQPIEFINEVPPDCCGRLFVELRGCAEIFEIANENGVIVDCGFGLSDACTVGDNLPDERGRLPNEFEDECELVTTSINSAAMSGASTEFQTLAAMLQPDVIATSEGLPFFESLTEETHIPFSVAAGGFNFVDRDIVCGAGYGGTIFFMSIGGGRCFIRCQEEHGLGVGDRIVSAHIIDDEQVLIEHEVIDVENDISLFTQYTKFCDAEKFPTSGIWLKLTGRGVGPDGGGLGVASCVKEGLRGTRFENEQQNLLSIGDKITVTGTGNPRYDVSQIVVHLDGTAFITNLTPEGEAGRSLWLAVMARGGGVVMYVRPGNGGTLRITCEDYHGLKAGDTIAIVGKKYLNYVKLFTVSRILSATEFSVVGEYVGEDSGIWYLVRSHNKTIQSYASNPTVRSISLWTDGLPQEENWTCFHKQISATLRFQPRGAAHKVNGGIIFNYREDEKKQRSFSLLEIDFDAGKVLRLWQVKDNAWTIWAQEYIPELQVDAAYRLTLDIIPYSEKSSDAYVTARLDGFEQETQHQIEPKRIPFFTPSNGLIGMHANRTSVLFNNFSVRHIE